MPYRVLILMLLLTSLAEAQVNRYFVYFKDKNGTPYSISHPNQFLTSKSLARRTQQGISITTEDLPVNPDYVNQVKSTGAKTFFTSRWWNGVLIESDAATVALINSLPIVKETILVAPGSKLMGGRKSRIRERKNNTAEDPVNQFQLQQLGLEKMHADGLRGEGIPVAVFDSGFEGVNLTAPFAHLFSENRVKYTYNFVSNTTSVYELDDHGTEVLSVMAAFTEGSYVGGAYKADYYLFLTEDVSSEYRIEEFNWTFAAEKADSLGVYVINSSLGYNTFDDISMNYTPADLNGKTAIITQAAQWAIDRGMIVVCSAGNEGSNSWKFVTPPADAPGILAIGSVTGTGLLSSFSSMGPTADSRIKPDLVALGSGTSVVRASGAIGTSSGTSLASPLVASLAVGVWQGFPLLSATEVGDMLKESGTLASNPNNQMGYGIPNYNVMTTAIREPKSEVLLYPNPVVTDIVTVSTPYPSEGVQIIVYDTRGSRVLESSTFSDGPVELDFRSLRPGLYLVFIRLGRETVTKRILKL